MGWNSKGKAKASVISLNHQFGFKPEKHSKLPHLILNDGLKLNILKHTCQNKKQFIITLKSSHGNYTLIWFMAITIYIIYW